MGKLKCWSATFITKDSQQYSRLGDGDSGTTKTMHIQKDGKTMTLDEDDIIELRRALSHFDPRCR